MVAAGVDPTAANAGLVAAGLDDPALLAATSLSAFYKAQLATRQCTAMCMGYSGVDAFVSDCLSTTQELDTDCPYRGCQVTLDALAAAMDVWLC